MTVCLYLNGGVPIIITDTVQSRPRTVVYSPENCNFICQRGRLKALRANADGDMSIKIANYPLSRKWKLFKDNVVIAFSGARAHVDRLIRDYGDFIENADGSGAVVEKLDELQSTPGSPRIGFNIVAPTSVKFTGGATAGTAKFWPFDSAQAVGTGANYIHFMYNAWLQTQIGCPVALDDRSNYIMMASDFVAWLNANHVVSSAPYTLRRYRQKTGRTFGGFFQGIYYDPEEGRWLDLCNAGLINYARLAWDKHRRNWFCEKLVREVRFDLNREVHVKSYDRNGCHKTEVFPIEDPFGTFNGFEDLKMPCKRFAGHTGLA